MRFIEVPALITEDIENPNILDITEDITASISGTTLTIDGDSKVSGEVTITLTGDVTVSTVTTSNIRQPSIHKITIKTNGTGNFTYIPNNTVTASSVSTTTKTGSDLDILLITTAGGDTYLDLDVADYVSPAANFSNVLTGFNVSELTSAYGATAKLYKPDGTLLTTVNSPATGSGVNFGYTESSPGDVIYKLEVTDDLGRKSKYNLPRKWINYAMGTTSTPGFQKFRLEGINYDYTTTVTLPSLGSSSKARVHKTTDHGYMGINFKIQGRNSPSDDWVDIDDTGENENADESAEFLAFGDYLYHRVWVKPTAKATTTVSSSNVVTLTLSNVTEDVTTKTITGADPFEIDETSNVFVFEEPTKIGSVPYSVTVGTETYTNAVTATTEEVSTVPNTDMTAAGPNKLHDIQLSQTGGYMSEASGNGKYIAYNKTNDSVVYILKGDPVSGYTDYTTITYSQVSNANLVGSMSYDGKYIIIARARSNSYHYEIWKHDDSAETYTKLSQTVQTIGTSSDVNKPAFVPAEGNYNFAISGGNSSNGQDFSVQLYKHSAGTDTWTAQTIISNPRPGSVQGTVSNRSMHAKSFTKDGKYLMFGNTSTYGGYDVFNVNFDENTVTHAGNWVNNGDIGYSGAITSDGKYILLFDDDSNSRKVFKNNDAGDWSSSTDVTSDFTFADADNDQGHDICFFGDNSEYFVSTGASGGAVRVYSWYAKKGATLAFTNPTLSLTTSDVTITSAKLYRDDVLFHTYGTESNVVLRSDQTGTYQAIVNDVYYSNRVTPDFTTTRSVSAPQLEFDGYNKLTIKTQHKVTEIDDEINFDTAQGGDWIDAYTKRYIYLSTDSSGDYIYWLWDTYTGDSSSAYTWKGVSGRRFSAVHQIKYSPSTREWLDEGSSNPTTLTKETINGVEYIALYNSSTLTAKFVNPYELLVGKPPTSTTLGLPDGTTRDLTTQSSVYIYKPGTYTANVQTSDTFAYLSNTTGNLGTSTNDVSPSATTISTVAGTWNGSYEYQLDTSQTTDSAIFYELYNIGGSAADNRHGLEFRKETDGSTKVYAETASNSLHPYTISINSNTPTASVTISGQVGQVLKGFNSSTLNFEFTITSDHLWTTPKLSFDGFNKLSIDNITQTSSTITYPNDSTVSTNAVSDVYIKDIGEYVLEASDANTFVTSNVEVGALDTVPGFTAAFHHGAFSASDYSSAYSSVSAAATAGFVYSDTPAGTYSWGTLAHVKERENPSFANTEGSAHTTLDSDYSSTYGWTTNSGWEVSAKDSYPHSSLPRDPWVAFSKHTSGNHWLSNSSPSTSSPQWLKIKYPSQQVIKSYVINSRFSATPYFPTAWKLQGANTDIGDTDTGWTDIGSEQTQTAWVSGQNKSFDLSTNTTAYQYYRLRITGSRESTSSSNDDYVAIGHWFLNTANEENTTNHDQYTRYTYTPASSITANVLRVAGGGGGSGTRGGGGGAGGLLYSENVSLSGTKSIVVGNGGIGYEGTQQSIENGYDTVFTGLTTSIGGGHGGGNDAIYPAPGGSGGGGSTRMSYLVQGASGTSGQGNSGGNGNSGDSVNGGGGGGAGAVGGNNGGVGGVGLDYSSVFGTTYGVSGFFAGGGGGGNSSGSNTGGNGGGGTIGTNSGHGVNHTGGGGAGTGNGSSGSGDGGSGIVIIKKLGAANPPALNFDGYNKLSIDNTYDKSRLTVPVVQAESGFNFSSVHADHVNKLGYPFPASGPWAHHHFVKVGTDGDKVLFDLLYVGTAGNPNATTTVAFDTKTGIWSDPHPGNDPDSFSSTESGTYTSTLTITSNNSEVHFKRGDGTYLGFITLTGWDQTVADNVYTIKKDGAAFATTTSNTVYIRNAGTYTAEVKGSGAYVTEVSKVVSGDITEFPNYVNATSFYYGGGVVDNTGKLYTWGHDGYGDSGRGASDRVPTHVSSISDPVSNVWRGDPGFTMAAKTSTDKWYMWGRNTYNGVLGNTTNTGNVTTPEDVTAKVTTYFGDQTVSANKIIKMVMGEHHAAALTAGGKVWSWGGESQNWPFGSVGHALPGNGSPNYYECVSVSGTTYLYKRPNKPSNHGSEIKFVADSTTGSGRYTGTWQDASTVNYPNAFQDPALHPTTSGTPSYTPTHNDTTLYLYNNENHDATCTVDYSTVAPAPVKNLRNPSMRTTIQHTGDWSSTGPWDGTLVSGAIYQYSITTYPKRFQIDYSTGQFTKVGSHTSYTWWKNGTQVTMPFTASEGDTIKLDDDSTQPPYDSEFTMGPLGTNTELSNITDIQSLSHGTAAFDSSGNVWFWGTNGTMSYTYPTKILDSSSIPGVVGMVTNAKSFYAWKSDGTFYTRGAGTYGQLANGASSDQYTSWQTVTTLQGKTIKRVFGGNENMFVWTDDGVYGAGRGNNYKNGDGGTGNNILFDKSTTLSALSIKEIDFGHATGLVLTTDGRGYMWGEDASNSMANALSGHQSGAAEATSISTLSLVHIPSPSITYDGKNKLTVGGTNYADTSTVTYYSNTYNLGTAKTMYVKDIGDYVFKISGTDKYVESNVHVSSVDLAGATTKPIDFDGYNKLTLISPGENVVSNVTYFSNTYELGSASTFYIKDQGTYDLEMSGSNVFALSNTVVGSINTLPTRLQGSDISTMGTTNYTRYGVPSSQSIDVEDFLFNSSSNINPCIDFIHLTNSQDTFVFDLESVKTINKIRIYAGNTTPNWASRNTGSVVKLYNGSTLVYTSLSLTFSRSSPETYYGPYEEGKDYNTLLFTTGYTNIDKITVETLSTSAALGRVEVNDFTDTPPPSLTFDNYNKLTVSNFTTASVAFTDAAITGTAQHAGKISWSSDNKLTSSTTGGWVTARARTTIKFNKSTIAGIQFRKSRTADYWNIQILTPDDTETWMTSSTADVILANQKPFIGNQNGTQTYNVYSGGYSNQIGTKNYVQDDLLKIYFDDSKIYSYKNGVLLWENAVDSYYTSNSEFYIVFGSQTASSYGLGNVYDFDFVDSSGTVVVSNPRTGTLTDPNGSTYALGQTQDTIYIKDEGDYTLDVQNNDQKAIVAKTVGTVSTPPVINHVTLTSGTSTFFNFSWSSNHTFYPSVITDTSVDISVIEIRRYHAPGEGQNSSEPIDSYEKYLSWYSDPLHYYEYTNNGRANISVSHDRGTGGSWDNWGFCIHFTDGSKNYCPGYGITFNKPSQWFNNRSGISQNHTLDPSDEIYAPPSTAFPSLTFDTYNKLTIANVDSDATSNIDFFSNTYEMGSRKELIINDTGTYHANIYSSNTLALVKKQVTDTFPTTETQKIIESDRTNTYTGGTDDWFGIAVSISGDYAIVGSPYGDEDASNGNTLTSAGAAYIFKHNGTSWVEQQKIVPNVRESGFRFGWSVSISGDYVIVGTASTDGADAGEAYIFKRSATTSTWTQEYKLVASDASGDDQFGNSVSISGDYAIVGASYEDLSGSDGAGAAYIFKRSGVTWTEETKVVASDRAGGDKFGKSVSISGDYAIVGSHNEDHDVTGGNVLSNAGSAYIFKRSAATSTWIQEAKIVASDRAVGDQFGWSVSISGDYAIVGSVYEDHDVTGGNVLSNAGSAYVFKRSGTTWTQETKIVASDRAGSDYFGASVSISGDYAIVGAHYEDHDFSGANYMSAAGSAYIFKRSGTTWTQTSKISASDRGGSDYFGYSVSISGNRSIVGAYGHDYDLNGANFVSQTGACYLFERPAIGPDTTITHEPTFTSASAVSTGESGWAVSASSQYNSSYVPWYAFNDGTGSWHSAEPDGGPHWLKIQLPTKKVLSGYDLKARDDSASLIRAPKTWVLEGSNDDSTWTELEPYHTNDESWTGGSTPPARQFSISTTTAYKYYRVYITLATDDNEAVAIGEFTLNIKPPASPALNFDGYNKLTAPVLDASFTAERLSDWDSSNSGKTVVANSGDWPETTAGITEYNVLQNGDKSYQKTSGGSSRDSAQLFDTISSGWANASHGASGTHSPMTWGYKFTTGAKKVGKMILTQPPNTHPAGNVTIKYWDGSAMVTVSNQSPTGMTSEVDLSSTEFTFDIVSAQYWQIDCYRHSTHNGTTYTGLSEWQLYSGRDPVTTVLTKGSDSWDVGTASNVYIDAAGTYDAQAKNSNTFVIKTSNVVSAPVTPKFEWKADGTETQILLASDRDTNTQLGYDAAIDGDYIIGGGPQDDEGGSQAGAAYIFKRTGTTWTQQAKLIVSDAAANDQAGEFVNIFGDYAIIGVYTKSSSAGAAYIFKRDTGAETWTEQEKITASDAAASDKFGNSVSINSDYAIVGSPYNDSPDNSGSAYIFIRSGSSWTQQAKLTASDAASNDEFGLSVDISGDYVISGANSGDQRPGSAYVFKYDATHPPDDLPPVDSVGTGFNYKRYTALDTSTHYVYKMWRNSANDWRTLSPASANTIKVLKTDSTDWSDNDTTDTNPTYIDTTTYSGKVSLGQSGPIENYRFSVPTFGIWNQQAKLQASDGATSDRFGKAVALSGDYAVIGAYADDSPSNSGSAYIFKKESTYVFTGTSPSTITLGGFWYTDFSRWYQKSTSDATSSYVRYILWNSSGQVGANYGTSFYTNSSGDLILDVNDSTGGSSTPFYFVNNTTSTTVSSGTGVVSVGDSIELFTSLNTSEATFTVPSVFAPTSGDVWSQQAKLLPSDAAGSDNFGWKVEISGDIAVIGAYHADPGGVSNAGSAYIFERSGTTWTEIKKLTASTHATTDGRFGEGLGVSGTTVVVGAGYEDVDSVTHAGALHVFDKVYVGPTLTYDNSNKLSLTGVTTPSTNLTVGTNAYDIGSAKVVFIKDQGTYTFHTNDGDQALILSNVVSSTPTGTTYLYNVYSNPSTRVSNYSTANTSKAQVSGNGTWPVSSFMATHNVLNNGDKAYGKTDGGSSRDPAQLFDTISSAWGEASHGTNGTHSPMSWGYEFTSGAKMINKMILYQPPNTHPAGNVTIKYWDGTSMTTVSNQSPTGMTSEVALSSTEFTFDAVSSQYWQIDCYRHATQTTGYTGLSEWEIYSAATSLTLSGTTPSQVYDNTKTITVSNIPSTQTGITSKIYKGATAYTIHATEPTSNVIIKNTGSYVSVFTTSNIAYLTNTVNVNATPTTTSDDTTIEDATPIVTTTTSTSVDTILAFHYGSFDTVYGDADVEEAANNGRIFDDTPSSGTSYTWGTLDSTPSTASNQTTYTWTPTSDITGADVLMVAGGGGGGKQVGGGGGAGGLLHHTNQTLSGQKTIVVGDGGIGGDYTLNGGASNGNNTTFTGFDDDAIAGGRGASYSGFGSGTGGSGGGGGGNSTTGQTGTSGQGNSGGSGRNNSWAGGGGGGAGAAGQGSPSNNVGGYGGAGLDKSSVFGTTYGDSGWFAGGGGGCASTTNTVGAGGQGGGGQGGNTAHVESGVRKAGTKHTGGGGGGTRDGNNFSGGSVSYALSQDGGKGGSGIVLVKFTTQVTTTTTTGGLAGSTAVPVETTTDAPSVTLDATDTTVTDPILDLDFTTTLPEI